MNLLAVDTVHPKRNNFVTGVKINATGESKFSDSPAMYRNYFLDLCQKLHLILLTKFPELLHNIRKDCNTITLLLYSLSLY